MGQGAGRGRQAWQGLISGEARGLTADWLLSLLLVLVALAVRLPYLMLVPRYTDEAGQVLWALDIVRGTHLPLTSIDPYMGPLFAYLVAGLFGVLGVSPVWPRLLVAVVGALLVGLTYWTGRLMWNRLAGLLAAGLTLTNPVLVSQLSHNGWSDSLTPFFATLTLLALYLGATRKQGMALASSGLLAGLTLQTHPTSGAALAGMAVWFALQSDTRAWLRRPAPYVALGLFGLAYAPMLVANLRPDSPMLRAAEGRLNAYAPTLAPAEYLARLLQLLKTYLYVIGGLLPPAPLPMRIIEAVIATLAVAGLVLLWQRRQRLIPCVALSTLLLLPPIVAGFSVRYFSALIPLTFVAIGVLLAHVIQSSTTHVRLPLRRLARGGGRALAALLVLSPLVSLTAHYQYAASSGLTNAPYFQLSALLRQNNACGPALALLDPDAPLPGVDDDDSRVLRAVSRFLILDGCPHALVAGPALVAPHHRPGGPRWLLLPASAPLARTGVAQPNSVTTFSIPTIDFSLRPLVLLQVQD